METHEAATWIARRYAGGLLWDLSRDDARQCAAIGAWDYTRRSTSLQAAVHRWCDETLRALGYCRVRMPDGSRHWMRGTRYWWEIETGQRSLGYRQMGGAAKRAARLKVSPERRREIARLGALARRRER